MSDHRVTRKVKQGPVEIDYDDSALIVNYEIETVSSINHMLYMLLIS